MIPLSQHIGAPCKAIVSKGDHVKVGQMIGEPVGPMSAAVHASVSGTVVAVQPCILANGTEQNAVIIDNDFADEWEELHPVENPDNMTLAELCDICRQKGIVGMGGATFPTAVKLNIKPEQNVDTLVINGVECEPYLSADHRLMLEHAEEILKGVWLIQKAIRAEKTLIGIEENKPDAIALMSEKCAEYPSIKVVPLKVQYPQGGEKQLIYALTGRKVPMGGLPLNVGTVVSNVATCHAICRAVYEGRPVIDRVLTMGGSVNEPANYLARIGSPVEWFIDTSKGLKPETKFLLSGGPMMGMPLSRVDIPITKGTSGILALETTDCLQPESACIRCGRCVEACPMRLMPMQIDRFMRKDMFAEAEAANVLNCIECGACSWSCPAKRNLTQSMRVCKNIVTKRRKEAAAKAKAEAEAAKAKAAAEAAAKEVQ